VLDRSPFYAEGGGQLADEGRLVLSDGTELRVTDVQTVLPGPGRAPRTRRLR
jgi:alanyl-tRNA synthetase